MPTCPAGRRVIQGHLHHKHPRTGATTPIVEKIASTRRVLIGVPAYERGVADKSKLKSLSNDSRKRDACFICQKTPLDISHQLKFPAKGQECRSCGKPGHFAINCGRTQEITAAKYNKSKKTNTATMKWTNQTEVSGKFIQPLKYSTSNVEKQTNDQDSNP